MNDETEIVRVVMAGNSSAFAELYSRYNKYGITAANRILRRRDLAENAVHDAWIKVRSAKRFDGPSFRPWFVTIVRHAAFEVARRAGKVATQYRPTFENAPQEQALLRDELAAEVMRAVEALPERDREMVMLRRFEDATIDDIAARFGLSQAATRCRIHRAYEKLRIGLGHLRLAA